MNIRLTREQERLLERLIPDNEPADGVGGDPADFQALAAKGLIGPIATLDLGDGEEPAYVYAITDFGMRYLNEHCPVEPRKCDRCLHRYVECTPADPTCRICTDELRNERRR